MNPLVIIPTYVSLDGRGTADPTLYYDHMTPLSRDGELPRCLQSLTKVQGIGAVAVLVVAEEGIEEQAGDKIRKIAMNFPELSIMVLTSGELDIVRRRFEQLNFGRLEKEVGLAGYSAARNLGLVLANVLGFDSVVFLDDDEIVDDEDFLIKAVYGLGKLTRRGIPILAKTGYYLNKEGSYHSLSKDKWYNRYWKQGKAFDAWIDKAMASTRLSRSNHVCGGCMALHKEAFKRLSFDPWITRGEDLDYLLNLRMYGSDMWFDNTWKLRHLPPRTKNEGKRFCQDVYRWLYEFRKMEYSRAQIDLHRIKPESLMPYPGPFLEQGIKKRVRRTAFLRSLACKDKASYREAKALAAGEADEYAQQNCSKYFEFQYIWPDLMACTEGDSILRNALLRSAIRAANEGVVEPPAESTMEAHVDAGLTSDIRMNLAE